MDSIEIVKRYDALVTQRKTVEDVWEVINQLVVPFRGDFFRDVSNEHAVSWRDNRNVFDSTAIDSANTLAASIHGSLTSPAIRWFELAFRDDELNTTKEAREWLEKGANLCFTALQDSNFNLEANETYLDLVSYGTSMIIEEVEEKNGQFQRLNFQSVPVEEMWFEQDHAGQVHRAYRRHKWTAVQIITKFGDMVPESIKEMAQTTKGMDEKLDVIMCIFPREDKSDGDVSKVLAPKERPFGMKYVCHKDAEELGEEGGYYEMPAFVPRWRKTSKSMWGHGPAMIALPDILTINQLVELILKATEKVVDPPTKVTERGLLSDLDLEPAGMTVVRTMDSMEPYESGARFDVSQLQREQLKQAIRSIFYVDQLELKESPAMTATEVQTRYELMQRLLGPTLGRLQSDYLDPLVQRTFNILYRSGQLGEPPEIVFENSGQLDIIYTGPLVRAQRADIAQGVMRWAATLAELSEIKPEVLDIPNWDEIAKELGSLEGVPAKLMRSDADVIKDRKARQKKQEEMEAAAKAQEMGAGMEAMGKGRQAVQAVAPEGAPNAGQQAA
jgi:frataxin-like iron-binding protein CyaY